MSSYENAPTPQDHLVDLYNDLADELNADKELLSNLKGNLEIDAMKHDPSLNYLQGKVTGFEVVMNALQAHIVTQKADKAGKLDPTDAA